MKKAEEYLKSNKHDIIDAIGNNFYNTVSYQIHEEIIKEIIKQAQSDAIDAAVKRCAEEAEADYEFITTFFGDEPQAFVEKDSILQVVDKLKKELE